jgi:hypothetical protein
MDNLDSPAFTVSVNVPGCESMSTAVENNPRNNAIFQWLKKTFFPLLF